MFHFQKITKETKPICKDVFLIWTCTFKKEHEELILILLCICLSILHLTLDYIAIVFLGVVKCKLLNNTIDRHNL